MDARFIITNNVSVRFEALYSVRLESKDAFADSMPTIAADRSLLRHSSSRPAPHSRPTQSFPRTWLEQFSILIRAHAINARVENQMRDCE